MRQNTVNPGEGRSWRRIKITLTVSPNRPKTAFLEPGDDPRGHPVATSSEFGAGAFNLANGKPLKIGFGQHDFFYGRMKNVRIYKRALPAAGIKELSDAERPRD